jgi:hypothetical protein
LLATALVTIAAVALTRSLADARPATVEVVLNPSWDTYLSQSEGAAKDAATELQAGWIYTTRGREARTYLAFPLDPRQHPPDGLLSAELWLWPEEPPHTSQIVAAFVVSTMTEAPEEGRVAPRWFASGAPSLEVGLDRSLEWKRFVVRDMVLQMLRNPSRAHGFAISGKNPMDDTRWDFVSMEGDEAYPAGNQPRLVLYFRDDALPTATSNVTATATDTPSQTPTASRTPTVTWASATPTPPVGTAPATAPATSPVATVGTPEPALLPIAQRRR